MKCHVAGNVGDAEQFCGHLCPLHPPGGGDDVRTVLTFHAGQVTGALFNLMKNKPDSAGFLISGSKCHDLNHFDLQMPH